MDRYAVIGFPVSHSKSPLIHGRFAQATGQDLGYEAIEIAPEALPERLAQLHAEGYKGLNATLPHKLVVAKICEQVTERAQLAGAVNTLVRTDTGWRGDNSDGEGFLTDLTRNWNIEVSGRRVLLLGAGGATRGILKPLLDQKPAELVLSNRNPWKPEELAEQFKAHGRIVPRTHASLKGDLYDVIINATSAGHKGAVPRLPGQLLAPGGDCYDLSYNKAHEAFAAWARDQGARVNADGLGLLVEQAAVGFELWRGVRPETSSVLKELRAG